MVVLLQSNLFKRWASDLAFDILCRGPMMLDVQQGYEQQQELYKHFISGDQGGVMKT